MRGRRTGVALIALMALMLMILIPPWVYQAAFMGVKATKPAGYHLLWSPPMGKEFPWYATIDTNRLLLQILGLGVVTAISLLLIGSGVQDEGFNEDMMKMRVKMRVKMRTMNRPAVELPDSHLH